MGFTDIFLSLQGNSPNHAYLFRMAIRPCFDIFTLENGF
jgi:hypothetical protein